MSNELKNGHGVVDHVIVNQVGHGDRQLGRALHLAADGVHRALVASPAAAGDAVVHIPE